MTDELRKLHDEKIAARERIHQRAVIAGFPAVTFDELDRLLIDVLDAKIARAECEATPHAG